MQTSRNPADWKEDPAADRLRRTITTATPIGIVRAHYPFSARVLRSDRSFYSKPVGYIFKYARTKMVPGAFPIECVETLPAPAVGATYIVTCIYSGTEVELFVPDDEIVAP